ncbi:MAG: nucleoside phosphorylase [Anaerolineae bacterium]|nr:nucleoside phosphorylase [Anaerolineae bacterium]
MKRDYPILEFDQSPQAFIEPSQTVRPLPGVPTRCVLCFFQEAIQAVCGDGKARVAHRLGSEIGHNPVYILEQNGQQVVVVHPGVGAPLAGAFLEELIALGCKQFIACGGAGVLNRELALGHVVIPVSAVRDEGTSYHYLAPSREVAPHPDGVAAIEKVLQAHQVPYVMGKTWTTDGIYRETPAKIQLRREEGCLTVEMEAAAFFAVAAFRDVLFAQILYSGDDLSGDTWDHRDWHKQASTREKVFWLAVEAALAL